MANYETQSQTADHMPCRVIGLSGKIGTGKTTLAYILQHELHSRGIGCHIFSFASILKSECAKAYNFDPVLCNSQKGKDTVIFHPETGNAITVRQALCDYGDKVRAADPFYFTDRMDTKLARFTGNTINIIDDVRVATEVNCVLGNGGLMVRMHPYPEWIPGPAAAHTTETALDDFEGFFAHVHAPYGKLRESAYDLLEQIVPRRGGFA